MDNGADFLFATRTFPSKLALWRTQYNRHRVRAKKRGIPFELTFWEWFGIWLDSGYARERGIRYDQYVMARHGDEGAYAIDNVRICTTQENHYELWSRPRDEVRAKMSKAAKKQGKQRKMRRQRLKHCLECGS
jgi:hypothetical protein